MNVLYNIFKPFKNSGIGYELIHSYSKKLTVNSKSPLVVNWVDIDIIFNNKKVFDITVGVSKQYKNEYYVSNIRKSIIERLKFRNYMKITCKMQKNNK